MTEVRREGRKYPPSYIRRIFAMEFIYFLIKEINYSYWRAFTRSRGSLYFFKRKIIHPKRKYIYRGIQISAALPSRAF